MSDDIARRTQLSLEFNARICKCKFCSLSYKTKLVWDELPFEAKQLINDLHDAWHTDSLNDGMSIHNLHEEIDELEDRLFELEADR